MNIFFVIIILVFVGGIVFLTNPFGESKETREQFLEKLTKYLEGKQEKIKEREDSYRIFFKYYEKQFLFEDVMEIGFSKQVNNGYLRNKTNKTLNLHFNPIQRGGIVHSEALIASHLDTSNYQEQIEIKLPEELKVFHVDTSDPIQAKALIEDPKIANIFAYYKEADVKGQHRMSLKIQNGVIIVSFHSSILRHPSLISLHTNIKMIDTHLEKISELSEAIEKVQT